MYKYTDKLIDLCGFDFCGTLFSSMACVKKADAVCAGTVLFRFTDNGLVELLLVLPIKGHQKHWGFPKGHREEGEPIEETAVRETYEETGIVPKLLFELPPVFTTTPTERKSVHLWLASQANVGVEPVPQPEEVLDIQWFNIRKLPNIHNYQKPIIRHALEVLQRNL